MSPGPLRGFRDYPPPEAGARSEILRRMRAAARRFGFVELESPSVEALDLYTTKSGAEIAKQVWAFQDKGGRDVALASETTPSLARIFVDLAKAEPLPVKWFTISKLWRYEEPQAGRTREFSQFNLDVLGVPGIEAEVEVLAASSAVLDAAGAKGLYAFRLNDRGLAEGIGRARGVTDLARFFRAVDRFRKTSASEFVRELEESGVAGSAARELEETLRAVGTGTPAADAERLFARLEGLGLDASGRAGLERMRALLRRAEVAGLTELLWVDPTVVRGLAYYTTSVFEAFGRVGDPRALFGGGRYDRLIELFGGPPTAACGLAIGDQTLEALLRANDRWPEGEPPVDIYVIALGEAQREEVLRIVGELRARGVSADFDLLGRTFPRQMKEAARRRAKKAWMLGLKEAAPGAITERDLSTGAQQELPRDAASRSA
ncbi:MAG: histidine--tRNA ligase [Thermoplasmata archaeon]